MRVIDHDQVIETLRARFERDPRVFAFWIEGSVANGASDAFSDLDVVLDVTDGSEDAVLAEIGKTLSTLGEVDFTSELERPNPFLWYRVFHIAGSSEHLLIDATVQRHSRKATFWEGADDRPKVIFDKAGVVRSGVIDTATQEGAKAQRLGDLRSRYAQRSRVRKYIERGRFLEAWAYYARFVLNPLVELLRLRYVPLQADHGLVHISDALPPDVRRRLEALYQVGSIADMSAKIGEADALFEEALIDFGITKPGSSEEAHAIVRLANDVHGSTWSIVRRLPGGAQQGAYELRDKSDERAVLKWHTRHLPARQLTETAQIVEAARIHGWPTSRWLAYGPLPRDGAYVIEEFIEGTVPPVVDDHLLEQLLAIDRIQADLRPQTDHDWSGYISRTVFEDPTGDFRRLRTHAETARLAAQLERALVPARNVRLPTKDLVHGDFTVRNVIVRDGSPYLVDAAHAGKGTRAYDLATLIIDHAADLSRGARRRVADECRSVIGTEGLLLCVAARMIVLMEWGLRHWPTTEIPRAVARCEEVIAELGAA